MDCTTKLVAKAFNDYKIAGKFSCVGTKYEAIVSNVLASECLHQLKVQLQGVNFRVSADRSIHGSIKLFPVVIQFFSLAMGGTRLNLLTRKIFQTKRQKL